MTEVCELQETWSNVTLLFSRKKVPCVSFMLETDSFSWKSMRVWDDYMKLAFHRSGPRPDGTEKTLVHKLGPLQTEGQIRKTRHFVSFLVGRL